MRRRWHRWLAGCGAAVACLALTGLALDRLFPLDLGRFHQPSVVVTDRDGVMLRAFTAPDGAWRLPVHAAEVDPLYLRMLIAYEDQRFARHPGVDPLAVLRAAAQWAGEGRIVSGASTLTMQVARLLEPRPRGLAAKLVQMGRALQLELHLPKDEILDLYLALAPFGGNLEGVRAASLAYFGKEPRRLTEAEAALLVALPRSPERLRPDRDGAAARDARNEVLERVAARGVIDAEMARQAMAEPVPSARLALPFLAPHLAERALGLAAPADGAIRTTIDARLQAAIEDMLGRRVLAFGPDTATAVVVLHHPTMELRAYVGAPDYFDARRRGMIDMAAAVRSPGSALKPFIYALAFDALLVHPDTLIADTAQAFGDYTPVNFDGGFHGDVTAREALQRSLNLPAVMLLDRIGPAAFDAALRRVGVTLRFDRRHGPATLPLALGGAGLTLEELVRLYTALPSGGVVRPVVMLQRPGADDPGDLSGARLFGPAAAWYTSRILEGVAPPAGRAAAGRVPGLTVGFKTGTSYGFRDAWAVGNVGDYTVGVWVGRPDGTPCSDCVGIAAAAPLLFNVADLLPPGRPSPVAPPAGVIAGPTSALPQALRRLGGPAAEANTPAAGPGPSITFPVDGTRLRVARDGGVWDDVALRAAGGAPPVGGGGDGRPGAARGRRSDGEWQPDGTGFARVEVIDAVGRSAAAEIFIAPTGEP